LAEALLLQTAAPAEQVLRATGNLDRCTPVCKLPVAFNIPCVYNFITELCRTLAEVILNDVNPNVRAIRQEEARHRKYKRLRLRGGQAYDRSAD
jgi:hypothetical protein